MTRYYGGCGHVRLVRHTHQVEDFMLYPRSGLLLLKQAGQTFRSLQSKLKSELARKLQDASITVARNFTKGC